jgi:tetratricopeptide (TPR) repeat protein
MPIEGPLRELGIHDVFQLLDLSRKTGALHVASELRDNEGTVWFSHGKVVWASIRSNPHPLGAMLVRSGKVTEAELQRALALQAERNDGRRFGAILVDEGVLTPRDLEKFVRLQVEEVVFELMSWREGFFSFAEKDVSDVPAAASVRISTESLLMEGARRIDEWSRIADKVPNLAVIPVLAPADDGHDAQLDLLPTEWEMLSLIDGETDLRDIATTLARSEFDVARIAYGLVSTGVIELRQPERVSTRALLPVEDPAPHLARAALAFEHGDAESALAAARSAQAADPTSLPARVWAARALRVIGRAADAHEELRRAAALAPNDEGVSFELAWAAAGRGEFDEAIGRWERWLAAHPGEAESDRVRAVLDTTRRLRALLEAHAGV